MSDNILTVTKVEQLTADSKAIYFEKNDRLNKPIAGQFLTLILNVNDKEQRRSYSLFTTNEEDMAIGVKRVPGGIVSNYVNTYIKAGTKINVIGPAGNFTYDPKNNSYKHLVLIAGGSGITPMMSILKTALTQTQDTKISMLYVNKSANDIIFKAELENLTKTYADRFTLHHYLDEENRKTISVKKKGLLGLFGITDEQRDQGFINNDRAQPILASFNIKSDAGVYLCGPGGLMSLMEAAALNYGIDKKDIHKENFVPSKVVHPKPTFTPPECEATVEIEGKNTTFIVKSGSSILQAGIEAGIDMPYSCREGTCTACYGTCKTGEVAMLNDESLTDDELNEGGMLPCVAFPKTKKINITIG